MRMKPAVVMLAVLAGAPSLAFADPPNSPPAPESPTPAASVPPALSPQTPVAENPVTPGPVVTPPKPAASESKERLAEQQLRLQGYKLTMVRGEEKYCRREAPLGSHLATVMHCVTVEEAEMMAREGREVTEREQRNTPGCLQPSMGGCGH
jgi:hypothetical protein